MGSCTSLEEGEERRFHKEAERQMKEHKERLASQYKVLLLGPGDSGKTTVLKQMRLIHKARFSTEEIEGYRQLVFSNIVLGLGSVIEAMCKCRFKLEPHNVKYLRLLDEPANVRRGDMFPPHYYQPLLALWNDPGVKKTYERANEFALPENLPYFFAHLTRFFKPTYVPNNQDILRCRARTMGINETIIKLETNQELRLVDVGGQKSERRKWMHCFQEVTTVLFMVSLSGYDTSLVEDSDANQMHDALAIWDNVCHSQWFRKVPLVLFLNKNDLFEEKIKSSQIRDTFPDYDGQAGSAAEGREYFRNRFLRIHLKARVQGRAAYVHVTTATDTAMVRVVMHAVQMKLCATT